MHRARKIAPRECGWKHGVSGHSAGEKTFVQQNQTRIDLTSTGLLMEGHFTQNPCGGYLFFVPAARTRASPYSLHRPI